MPTIPALEELPDPVAELVRVHAETTGLDEEAALADLVRGATEAMQLLRAATPVFTTVVQETNKVLAPFAASLREFCVRYRAAYEENR